MKLYSYWRSTAAYRVRIAFNIKRVGCEYKAIHLVEDGGEHLKELYKSKNPQSLVPTLETTSGEIITQSLAIIDYLDEVYPEYSLYPESLVEKAKTKALALSIACDIHPLNNLRVLKYLKGESWQQQQVGKWYSHWIFQGFSAIEKQLKTSAGQFCFGNTVSVADIFLVAQVYNANRFSVPLNDYPLIQKINTHCLTLQAFIDAIPENQPDCDA